MSAAVLCGIGSCLPPTVVTNAALAARLGTSVEWIETRTGIRARRVVEPGSATADLAVEACALAMKSAGVDHVDAVVLATSTPDFRCPGTAPSVAARLGLTGVAAMDVNAVCTGFLYAVACGAGLIATGAAGRVLVAGADTYSTIVDPSDRTTTAIFGDGAGAVVLRAGDAGEAGALSVVDLGSDGELAELIWIPAGDRYLRMRGGAVFRHAVTRMAAVTTAALRRAGWRVEDVDRLVGHQANARILAALAAELGVGSERVVSNIDAVGNTAAASIPLALDDAARAGDLRAGHRVVLTAFGGGLTWGATTLTWPSL